MKKFAVIISGQVRTVNRSFLYYLEKININYDVYIHYWSAENNSYENCGNLYNRHNIKNIPSNLHDIDNHSLYFLETNHLNDILWIVPINLKHIFSLYNYMYESSNIFNTTPENIIPKKINGNCIIDRDYIN